MRTDLCAVVERLHDRGYAADTLVTLARTPTDVPLGENEIEPTDPKITHYVHDVVRPLLDALGVDDLIVDELNNVVCRVGRGVSSRSLLLMTYTTAQHGNYTNPELEGQTVQGGPYGFDGDCVVGRGTSQNKGALASALAALRIVRAAAPDLAGTLFFAVNAEGQSSHRCSRRIIDGHSLRADMGVLAIGTERIVIGHRGRVDVQVTIRGEPGHSSEPERATNAIWGLKETLVRLDALKQRLTGRHPVLGGEQLEPYKLVTRPIAPHTIPGEAALTLDRRLLPGTDPDEATAQVRRALGDIPPCTLEVRTGVYHLPYLVSPDLPHVRSLASAHERIRGRAPEVGCVPYAFDAGYANASGIPTIMFGPAATPPPTDGRRLLGTEMIPVEAVHDFAKIYACAILDLLG
jgi:succinyl-diaminopimelate desuccinylase